jgi:molecular chaperone DnaJ
MPAKNYYVVLGVSPGESPAGIRAAYHELACRVHTGIAPAAGASHTLEINEAYEVLSDPVRRRAHDRESGVWEREIVWPIAEGPVSLLGQPEETHPSFDAFRERYLRNFTGRHVPKAERVESLTLDVTLSPSEAFHGCTVPVGVPVFGPCGECGGTGEIFPFHCTECKGSGIAERERTLYVRVPPGVHSGAVLEAPLDLFAIQNLYLRVLISISDAA